MFPVPPRPVVCTGSRDRERDLEESGLGRCGELAMLPAPPRPKECYQAFQFTLGEQTAFEFEISRTTPVSLAMSMLAIVSRS